MLRWLAVAQMKSLTTCRVVKSSGQIVSAFSLELVFETAGVPRRQDSTPLHPSNDAILLGQKKDCAKKACPHCNWTFADWWSSKTVRKAPIVLCSKWLFHC
jgi:hypothetical protein